MKMINTPKRPVVILLVVLVVIVVVAAVLFAKSRGSTVDLSGYPKEIVCGADPVLHASKFCDTPYISHYTCENGVDTQHCKLNE